MLEFAFAALVISLIAGALGFTGVARAASSVAKIVFGVFLLLALLFFALIVLGISLF